MAGGGAADQQRRKIQGLWRIHKRSRAHANGLRGLLARMNTAEQNEQAPAETQPAATNASEPDRAPTSPYHGSAATNLPYYGTSWGSYPMTSFGYPQGSFNYGQSFQPAQVPPFQAPAWTQPFQPVQTPHYQPFQAPPFQQPEAPPDQWQHRTVYPENPLFSDVATQNYHQAQALERDFDSPPPKASSKQRSKQPSSSKTTAPKPTEAYVEQSAKAPQNIINAMPQTLLVITDLNGTLIFRSKRSKVVKIRDHAAEFIDYAQANHKLMIWTSMQPSTIKQILAQSELLTDAQRAGLVATWSREQLHLSASDYHAKVQVYKRLEWVWADEAVQRTHPEYAAGGRWSAANTVLVDDSRAKAAAQPHNLLCVPELDGPTDKSPRALRHVVDSLECLKWYTDVSAAIRNVAPGL